MCVEILMPDGRTLVTMRDATEALGVIITDQPVYNGDLDICLCSLGVDRTAEANGYKATWDEAHMTAMFDPRPLPPDDLREAARLHHAAMDNAEAGNLVSAFDHEVRAATIYFPTRLEPSRSILCRSAACLALRIGRYAEAVALAEIGLAGSPPDCVRAELEDVREQATAIRKLENAMTDEQTLEEQFAELIIKHGPRSPVIHRFMNDHRDEGLFLRYALRLTQLQEYAADPELLRGRRNHMNDTEQDLRNQLAERMKKYLPESE